MGPQVTDTELALTLAKARHILRARDFTEAGIHPSVIQRLVNEGALERLDRGLYLAAGSDLESHESLALASVRVPAGVICLLSALAFHEIGTQNPPVVWLALPTGGWAPQAQYPPMEIVRIAPRLHALEVQTHTINGVPVRIYSPSKTVIDCFRFRNRIGLDVAMEALRETLAARLTSPAALATLAKECRIWTALRPYLEMAVG